MTSNDVEDGLKGLTVKVYKFVLKNARPTGIREVQRSLKLSSPTLALYHLDKLEKVGLLKKTMEGYEVDRVFLRNLVRFRRVLVPRYLFYFIFFASALIGELTFLKPVILSREYVLAVGVTLLAAVSYLYETIKTLVQKRI